MSRVTLPDILGTQSIHFLYHMKVFPRSRILSEDEVFECRNTQGSQNNTSLIFPTKKVTKSCVHFFGVGSI